MNSPRPTACPDFRDRLVAVAGGGARDRELDAHVVACSACRAFLLRAQRTVHELGRLPHVTAPRDLDGRVVAAMQAGFRQDRAVAQVRSLGRETLPPEVDAALWMRTAEARRSAPASLDARVDAELRGRGSDPGARMMRYIVRPTTPSALDTRVAQVYEQQRLRRARAERQLLLAGAAVLLVALTVSVTLFLARPSTVLATNGEVAHARVAPTPRPIVVQHVASPAELDPMLASTFAALTAGTPDAVRVTGGKL